MSTASTRDGEGAATATASLAASASADRVDMATVIGSVCANLRVGIGGNANWSTDSELVNRKFSILIDRSSNISLGLDVEFSDNKTLRIEAIDPDGLVRAWNLANPSRAVSVGDRIVSVNGKGDNAVVLCEECSKNQILAITLEMKRAPEVSRPSSAELLALLAENERQIKILEERVAQAEIGNREAEVSTLAARSAYRSTISPSGSNPAQTGSFARRSSQELHTHLPDAVSSTLVGGCTQQAREFAVIGGPPQDLTSEALPSQVTAPSLQSFPTSLPSISLPRTFGSSATGLGAWEEVEELEEEDVEMSGEDEGRVYTPGAQRLSNSVLRSRLGSRRGSAASAPLGARAALSNPGNWPSCFSSSPPASGSEGRLSNTAVATLGVVVGDAELRRRSWAVSDTLSICSGAQSNTTGSFTADSMPTGSNAADCIIDALRQIELSRSTTPGSRGGESVSATDSIRDRVRGLLHEQQTLRVCVTEQGQLNREFRRQMQEQKSVSAKISDMEFHNRVFASRAPQLDVLWARPDMPLVQEARPLWERSRMLSEDLREERRLREERDTASKDDREMLCMLEMRVTKTEKEYRVAAARVEELDGVRSSYDESQVDCARLVEKVIALRKGQPRWNGAF